MADTTAELRAEAGPDRVQRPGAPIRLHHVAHVAGDTGVTVDFYTRLLGMDFVAAVLDDAIPSTREPVPYFHSFFRLRSGETMAFFEAPDLPSQADESHPAYRTFRHLALEVDTPADVDAWKEWLESNGVDVLGPVDHGIIYSIYFFDPNGVRLELTTDLDPAWRHQDAEAQAALVEWETIKQRARESGRNVAAGLDELAKVRSHRRTLHLDGKD